MCTGHPEPGSEPWQPPASAEVGETPLLSAVAAEAARVRVNLFCPGHKQGANASQAMLDMVGRKAMSVDLPELPALDNMFAPEGVIEEAQRLAADAFTIGGSDEWDTFFLVNGTTCGIEAAVLAVVRPGRKVVLPRNAHQSAVHALVLSGAVPVWVQPVYDSRRDLLHGVDEGSISDALREHVGQVDAVLLISPTYHGVCSNVREIARLTHKAGAQLIVDEAHGAHFPFHEALPNSATECDADIIVQSTHKTLAAWSQAAMMHTRKSSVEKQRIASALQLVQSTSPNYILLASLDAARDVMARQGYELMAHTIAIVRNCALRIASLKGFGVLGVPEDTEHGGGHEVNSGGPGVFEIDPTRLTVLLPPEISGYDLDTHLIDRFGVYAELPAFRHITFVFSPGNSQHDVDTLVTSLSLFNATNVDTAPEFASALRLTNPVFGETSGITPRDAFFAETETVNAEDAVGRICAETLCPYPPGIPVLVPGERITGASVHELRAVLDAGGSVSGASDDSLSTIRVLTTSEEERCSAST